MIARRTFLSGLIAAPVVITTPGILMPVRKVFMPDNFFIPITKGSEIFLNIPELYYKIYRDIPYLQIIDELTNY